MAIRAFGQCPVGRWVKNGPLGWMLKKCHREILLNISRSSNPASKTAETAQTL